VRVAAWHLAEVAQAFIRGLTLASLQGDVCTFIAEGKCCWEHCKLINVKVLSESESLQYRRALKAVASTLKLAWP
jgi:hypothetical protein